MTSEYREYLHLMARHCLAMARACGHAEPRSRQPYRRVWQARAADYRMALVTLDAIAKTGE